MRSLYRMSRTAGVGLQDYAAVNVFAVTGLILAFASVLVLIFSDVPALLILPLAAIVICVIAFVQIQGSNGTQTGRGLAVAGLLIALAFGGTNVYGRMTMAARHRADAAALRDLVKQFETAALAGKAADAHALFDAHFRENVKLETFERTLTYRVERMFGQKRVQHIALGDRIEFETGANGATFATALLIITADGTAPNGQPFRVEEPTEFRTVDDAWKIDAIPNWFAATPAAPKTAR